MKAIRFHGRGGQGVKTAGRIVGTAAFLEGYVAQDSPIYGAERRGAPVTSFTRISQDVIRERGPIARPDLVIVADASLLEDPAAKVLEGVSDGTAVFVNTGLASHQLHAPTPISGVLCTMDVTDMTIQQFGTVQALSAPLAAVAGRLLGLPLEAIQRAVTMELADLGLSDALIRRNQELVARCYEMVRVVPVSEGKQEPCAPATLWTPVYEAPTRGTARITAGANSALRKTGAWRTFRPVLVPDKCNGCWLCFVACPEGVISMTKDDKPVIDYDHCKGCQICVQECPTHALIAERESKT
jgi:pyruvate ferredoxin oxidoreductase gamma subunit